MPFEVVACISSHDSLAYHYLAPIARHPDVSRLWIVRPQRSLYGDIPKSEYVLAPARFRIWRFVQMIRICLRLGGRKEVRAFVSFNPFPYGFIAYIAARRHNKPIHFGFIGSDWYRHATGILGPFLLPVVKKARFITATGERMRAEMIERGLDSQKVHALLHCIDLDRLLVNNPGNAKYACVYVGELIERKRVDLILRAFAKVKNSHPDARLCIVGDGPLKGNLREQARRSGIEEAVDFVGFTFDVRPYLADSKIILIASDMEGFPFSMIEGICAGLVPVSTPVGTIPDLVVDGENGLLFPRGDAEALADCVNRLLDEQGLYEKLRAKALELRNRFSYDAATAVWDKWFNAPPS